MQILYCHSTLKVLSTEKDIFPVKTNSKMENALYSDCVAVENALRDTAHEMEDDLETESKKKALFFCSHFSLYKKTPLLLPPVGRSV